MMLHSQEPNAIELSTIVSFYPLLDRTQPREDKYKRNPIAAEKVSTPRSWDKLFVESYNSSGSVDISSPYLSPGLASDAILRDALPKKSTIFTCSWDALFEEGQVFRKRLLNLGKAVEGTTIEGVNHAFDRITGRKRHSKNE
ncbi:hypothetical protein NQZ79_g8867 [Umbelopsis isabellina]|nr:hypothetical protein NQZ79_g8867 [Umbelopsis isabellina]